MLRYGTVTRNLRCCCMALLPPLVIVLLSCTNDYNPFQNPSNAGVHSIYASFADGDTLDFFTTETLKVVVTAKEQVAAFRVHAPGNRLWASGDTSIDSTRYQAEPFTIYFSFYDTGYQSVVIEATCHDRRVLRDTMSVYVQSPLRQAPIDGVFGDTVRLSTLPVGDRDVSYYWSFGGSSRIMAQRCSTRTIVQEATASGTGRLWVSDGFRESPATPFAFWLRDTTPPLIMCVNDGAVGADTIYTSDTLFNFKVRITDRGDRWVDSASVNGQPFDRRDNRIYYKLFANMHDFASDPLRVNVFALDNFQDPNTGQKTFVVFFSDSVSPGPQVEIGIIMPEREFAITGVSPFQIFGTIENRSPDTATVNFRAILNGLIAGAITGVAPGHSLWNRSVDLVEGNNLIELFVMTAGGDTLAAKEITLAYMPGVVDTTPPVIFEVLADGRTTGGFITSKERAGLSIRAFDGGAGISVLSINGKQVFPDWTGMLYHDSVDLYHSKAGNEITIRAVDGAGNENRRLLVLYRDRLPVISRIPQTRYVQTYSWYHDTIEAIDPDGDTLTYSKSSGPAGLLVSPMGHISWMSRMVDTGLQQVTVRIWDGYQPVFANFSVLVYPAENRPLPVRFSTTTADFPVYLEATRDSMRVVLRADSATGIRPLRFSARIFSSKSKILLSDAADSVVRWKPSLADTGYCQLMVIVRDQFPHSDTLYPRILVVPPNRPCSLSVDHWNSDSTPHFLDVNKKRMADTVVFHIHDPDSRLYERHNVEIFQARTRMISSLDSALADSFTIIVDPLFQDGTDTLRVTVNDKGNSADTLFLIVHYGFSPDPPSAPWPADTSAVGTSVVTLSWSGFDPDGDTLKYQLYFGTQPDSLSLTGSQLSRADLVIRNLSVGTYYWRIVASDWKKTTAGPIWSFSVK